MGESAAGRTRTKNAEPFSRLTRPTGRFTKPRAIYGVTIILRALTRRFWLLHSGNERASGAYPERKTRSDRSAKSRFSLADDKLLSGFVFLVVVGRRSRTNTKQSAATKRLRQTTRPGVPVRVEYTDTESSGRSINENIGRRRARSDGGGRPPPATFARCLGFGRTPNGRYRPRDYSYHSRGKTNRINY